MRVPFPHPGCIFSPPGNRALFSPVDVMPSVSDVMYMQAVTRVLPDS